nr:hypothetical protein [Tanacetum cinerariifolium]
MRVLSKFEDTLCKLNDKNNDQSMETNAQLQDDISNDGIDEIGGNYKVCEIKDELKSNSNGRKMNVDSEISIESDGFKLNENKQSNDDYPNIRIPVEANADKGLVDHIDVLYRMKDNSDQFVKKVRVEYDCTPPDVHVIKCLADRKLKEETLMHKTKVEESLGNAAPGMMKFYAWLINSFGNFHELDYNVLVKLQECWWKINSHKAAPFICLESYGQRPYANIKTKKAYDPYLEVNNILGRNYDIRNAQDKQGHEERRDDPTLKPPVCKIRRFEMMKYSFNADEDYIAIKESEYLN